MDLTPKHSIITGSYGAYLFWRCACGVYEEGSTDGICGVGVTRDVSCFGGAGVSGNGVLTRERRQLRVFRHLHEVGESDGAAFSNL